MERFLLKHFAILAIVLLGLHEIGGGLLSGKEGQEHQGERQMNPCMFHKFLDLGHLCKPATFAQRAIISIAVPVLLFTLAGWKATFACWVRFWACLIALIYVCFLW